MQGQSAVETSLSNLFETPRTFQSDKLDKLVATKGSRVVLTLRVRSAAMQGQTAVETSLSNLFETPAKTNPTSWINLSPRKAAE
jgi:hypothetical protein